MPIVKKQAPAPRQSPQAPRRGPPPPRQKPASRKPERPKVIMRTDPKHVPTRDTVKTWPVSAALLAARKAAQERKPTEPESGKAGTAAKSS